MALAAALLQQQAALAEHVSQFKVVDVLDSQMHRGRLQYLMDWLGYALKNGHVRMQPICMAPWLVHHFHLCHPEKPWPTSTSWQQGCYGSGDVMSYCSAPSVSSMP